MLHGRIGSALVAALIAGCSGDRAGSTTGDTEAVRVLPVTQGVVVGAEIDADSHTQFTDVLDVRPMVDGGFWVIDGSATRRIRRFDAQGNWLGEVSREGGGPGEFSNPDRLVQLPDGRVAVLDPGMPGRVQIFGLDGSWSETLDLGREQFWDARGDLLVDDTGRLWLPLMDMDEARAERQRWLRIGLGPAPSGADTVVAPAVSWLEPDVSRPDTPMPAPYAADVQSVVGPAGSLWMARTDRYAVHRVPLDGEADTVPELEGPPGERVEVSADERRDRRLAMEEVAREFFGEGVRLPEIPSHKPHIQEMRATSSGHLLVRLHTPSTFQGEEWGEVAGVWDLFDLSDGSYEGRIELPGEHEPFDMVGDTLWTLYRDTLGVESVRSYRVGHGGR